MWHKKLIISLSVIFLIIGMIVCFFVFDYYQSKSKDSTINAEEYLKQKKDSEDTEWRDVSFEQRQVQGHPAYQEYNVGNCLKITSPFPVKIVEPKQECALELKLSKPSGFVFIDYNKKGFAKIEDVPDVKLRRNKNEEYKEREIDVNGSKYHLFQVNQSEYIITAFNITNGRLMIVTLSTAINKNLDQEFEQMLRSIKTQ